MNLFLGLCLLLLSVFISYTFSCKYTQRRIFYNDFLVFNRKLKQEIAFKHNSLIKIIENSNTGTDFYFLLKKFICENVFQFNIKYLNKEEQQFYLDYLKLLGKGDVNSQLEFLGSIEIAIIDKQKISLDDEKKYKLLYIKLGFLIGLILLIIVL